MAIPVHPIIDGSTSGAISHDFMGADIKSRGLWNRITIEISTPRINSQGEEIESLISQW
jgi:hypothetical protein